jgi:hypothetical protein
MSCKFVDIRLDGVDWWWKEIIQLWRPTLGLSLPSTALVIKADRNRQFHPHRRRDGRHGRIRGHGHRWLRKGHFEEEIGPGQV